MSIGAGADDAFARRTDLRNHAVLSMNYRYRHDLLRFRRRRVILGSRNHYAITGAGTRSPVGDISMTHGFTTRRTLLRTAGAVGAVGLSGLLMPVRAQGLAATPTMRGGANKYRPGAPIVARIGGGGFWMTGTVRGAGDGAPLQANASRSGRTRPKARNATRRATGLR